MGQPGISSIALRNMAYERLWGRPSQQIFRQTNVEEPHVDIHRYAPTWRFWAPARRLYVYITNGMADRVMPLPPESTSSRPRRIELCTYTRDAREAQPGRDLAAWVLHSLAHLPWRENCSFAPLETVTWGGHIIEGSDMTAFFFALPPFVDEDELLPAAKADLVLQVMTITGAERELAVRESSEALMDRFESTGVPPVMDWDRPSCV